MGQIMPIPYLIDNLDGYMYNLTAAATTSNKVIQQLVGTNAKQQARINELSNKIKASRANIKPAQGMTAT